MAGLTINCPLCGNATNIRTSDRPTPTTVTAELTCGKCGNFKGKFMGEITHIQVASWHDDTNVKNRIFEKYKHPPKE